MKLIKKEKYRNKTRYTVLGIKITVKNPQPSEMNFIRRAKELKKRFKSLVGYDLNLANPQTFNEKINWMKLYYRNDLLPRIVDKYEF